MMLIAKSLWAVLILIEITNALKIHDPCEKKDKECPNGSSCTWIGCLGRRCSCDNDMLPNVNQTSCVDVVPLDSKCNTSTACGGGPFSQCDLSSEVPKCVCAFGYNIYTNKTMCIPTLQGNTTAVGIGGSCNTDPRLTCIYDLQCINGTCQCGVGKRLANVTELRVVPKETDLCRPSSFQLGKPVNQSSKECEKATTTTTTTTTSTTTSPTTTTSTTTTTPTTTPKVSTTTPKPTTTSTTKSITTPTPTTTLKTTNTTTPTQTTTPSTTSTTTSSTTTSTTTTPPTTTQTTTSTTTTTPTPIPTTTTTTEPTTTTTTTTTTPTPSTTPTTTSTTTTTPTPFPTTTTTTELTKTTTSTTTTTTPTPNPTTTTTTEPTTTTTSTTTTPTPTTTPTTTSTTTTTPTPIPTTTTTTEPTTTTTSTTTTIIEGCECTDKMECTHDRCGEERCRCKLGYAESPDKNDCLKLSALGETCSVQTICQGHNTRCADSGVCDCAEGFERSDNGRWCRLQSKFGIDFPLLGEECNGGFFQDCYMYMEQTCVRDVCVCGSGLRTASYPGDIYASFPDEIQCVDASRNESQRDPQPCANGIGSRSPIDTKKAYERAKSKIKKDTRHHHR